MDAAPATLPMRVVTRLTGLSEHTLRAWERRNAAIAPTRTEGNARRYTERQVARLRLLRAAVERGHAIGTLVELSDDALEALARGDRDARLGSARMVEEYLAHVARLDAPGSASILAHAAADLPIPALVLELLAPLMREIGERWHAGALAVASEHLATAQVRALVTSLATIHPRPPGLPRVLLAAPERHHHDVSLALASLLVLHRGGEPVFLGADVPLSEILPAANRTAARVVVLACLRDVDAAEETRLRRGIEILARVQEIWLGVPESHALRTVRGVRVLHHLSELDAALAARLSPRT